MISNVMVLSICKAISCTRLISDLLDPLSPCSSSLGVGVARGDDTAAGVSGSGFSTKDNKFEPTIHVINEYSA